MRRIRKWFARRNSQIICVRTRRHEKPFIRTYVHVRGLFGSEKLSCVFVSVYGSQTSDKFVRTYVRWYISFQAQHSYARTYCRTYLRAFVHVYEAVKTQGHSYVRSFVKFWSRQESETQVRTYVRTYLRTYVRTYVSDCFGAVRNHWDENFSKPQKCIRIRALNRAYVRT